jgi:hypothetical protein
VDDPISEILHLTVNQGPKTIEGGYGRLIRRMLGVFTASPQGDHMCDLLFDITQHRLQRLRDGFPFTAAEVLHSMRYASRALQLSKDRDKQARLHFYLGQLGCLESQLMPRVSERELRLAQSHFVQAEQLGLRQAKRCGELLWDLLGREQACPVSSTHEPQPGEESSERVSLATPYLEQGLIALEAGDIAQAQTVFGHAKAIASLDLQGEDRWVAATFLLQAEHAIESHSRTWSLQYLRDAVHFYQPFAGQPEQRAWSKAIRQIAERGDLLAELAEIYREIAGEHLASWLNHFLTEEHPTPCDLPGSLLKSFEAAASHYSHALGSPYTTVEQALESYSDTMRKLCALYWHKGDYSSVVAAGEQILSYLPQRRREESAYFHSVLAHAYIAMSRSATDSTAADSLKNRGFEHATRAIKEDPATEQRHHLGSDELTGPPAPDFVLTGQIQEL